VLFCAVASLTAPEITDNHPMGFRFRRSVKILPGIRLNFGKRGISTSIGVRGAHVTFGRTGVRTTVGLPGSGLSYTHLERPHHYVGSPSAVYVPTESSAPQGSALRGWLWIGLIVFALVLAFGRPTTHVAMQVPAAAPPVSAARVASQAAEAKELAQVKTASLGVARLHTSVANSNTLKLSRVTLMPNGAICYQFHLKNSRGVAYVRSAVMDDALLKASGSVGFDSIWNSRCAHPNEGRDITADLDTPAGHPAPSKR
jgi:hypothetical protein